MGLCRQLPQRYRRPDGMRDGLPPAASGPRSEGEMTTAPFPRGAAGANVETEQRQTRGEESEIGRLVEPGLVLMMER